MNAGSECWEGGRGHMLTRGRSCQVPAAGPFVSQSLSRLTMLRRTAYHCRKCPTFFLRSAKTMYLRCQLGITTHLWPDQAAGSPSVPPGCWTQRWCGGSGTPAHNTTIHWLNAHSQSPCKSQGQEHSCTTCTVLGL